MSSIFIGNIVFYENRVTFLFTDRKKKSSSLQVTQGGVSVTFFHGKQS